MLNKVPITCRPKFSSNRTTKQVSKEDLVNSNFAEGMLHQSSALAGVILTSFTAKSVSNRCFYLSLPQSTYPGNILWSDLATAHYNRATTDLLSKAEVPMVTNFPQKLLS